MLEQVYLISSMDDIFSHFLDLTSYMSHQFIRLIEDLLFRDVSNCSDCFVDSSSSRHEHPLPSAYSIGKSVYDNCSSSSFSCNASRVLQIQESGTSYLEELMPVCSRFEIVLSNYYYRGVGFIFKGLMLPISGQRFSWRLTFASLRSMFCYVRSSKAQVRSIISRVWKTLHGSSGEIGWLQEAPGMAPVKDGSARFLELLECIRYQIYMCDILVLLLMIQ